MFPNPVPGGTQTLHSFQLFLIEHTRINSSAHYKRLQDQKYIGQIRETSKMCSVQEQGWETLIHTIIQKLGVGKIFFK